MTFSMMRTAMTVVGLIAATEVTVGSEYRTGQLDSDLVPSPVNYSVLLPDGYDQATTKLPLLLLLHAGSGTHAELAGWKGMLDSLWAENALPKMVVAMPSTGKPNFDGISDYVDTKDGSEKWYSFVVGPFMDHIQREYKVSRERKDTVVGGSSMGGSGALRVGLKNPQRFAGLMAIAPGVLPATDWKDVMPRNRFIFSEVAMKRIYGQPVDEDHWKANNPAAIVALKADEIRKSGIQIYIECGDKDYLNLHEGTEFLHRLLWDKRIPHEYHSVRGGEHGGRTVRPRAIEGLKFLDRVLRPPGPDPDPVLQEIKNLLQEKKTQAEQQNGGDSQP